MITNGNNKLFDIHTAHQGKVSDKWESYLIEYDRVLAPYRNKKINLLEIGIQNGGSLEIWSKYFQQANLLLGCDIDQKCLNLKFRSPNIKVVVGDITKKGTKKNILSYAREFDIIIEDGSHISSHIIKAFLEFFPFLKNEGVFIAEDLHCSYWKDWEGGLYDPYSAISFFKLLADVINFEHWGIEKERDSILKGFFKTYNIKVDDTSFLQDIHSIEFVNSMCIIKKDQAKKNILGKRCVSGNTSIVSVDPLKVKNAISNAPYQDTNFWATLQQNPNEEYISLLESIQHKDRELLKIQQELQYKQKELEKKNNELSQKEKQLQSAEKLICELMHSTSWKITHPIRLFVQLIKNIGSLRYQNIFIPFTKEYMYVRAIKKRLPIKLGYQVSKLIKKTKKSNFISMPWDFQVSNHRFNNNKCIVIIAELSIPQCKKYRVDQKVEMLQLLGYCVSVVSWTDYQKCFNFLQLANIVIFYRVPAFESVLDLFDEAERLGIVTVYDLDDLIFDKEELKNNSNNLKLDDKTKKEIYNGADLYKLALSKCQHAIASTTILGKYMKKHIKGEVYILPNCLDEHLLSYVNMEKETKKDDLLIKIVYGSGTSTHDNDFLEAAEALLMILKKYRNVQLVIHGILTIPAEFNQYSSQIKKIPVMPAHEYYAMLNDYDINIAPLENTIFNDSKSNIKFLEASIFSLPTVASPVYEFKKVIKNGENGFLANNTQEWFEAIEKLILDQTLRRKVGLTAFDTVMSEYRIDSIAHSVMKPFLEKHLLREEVLKNKKTQILMVNILFKPISFGGATIVVEEISKYLNSCDKFQVTIFTGFWNSQKRLMSSGDIVRYEFSDLPIIGVKFPEEMTPELEYKNLKMKERFKEVLYSVQPELVHFHSIQQLSASLLEACLEMNIPYVITLHDMWWLCEKQFMIMDNGHYCGQEKISIDFCISQCTKNKEFTIKRSQYLKPLLYEADLLLTPSRFQSSMYLSQELDSNKTLVNKNGILFPKKEYSKIRYNENIVRFAYLGGDAIHKGYYWLKEVFENIENKNYDLILVDLHKKLGSNSIDKNSWNVSGNLIVVDGYDYGQDGLDEFFKDIDVLLFPSQVKESFGLTVREALVRDVWVISTDAGGVIEDIVEGETGNIIDMNDQLGFQRAIEEFLKNPKFFSTYKNSYKHKIRSFHDQSQELKRYYNQVLEDNEKCRES